MKSKILFIITMFSFIFSNAQEVEIKNDQILLDGEYILKYEKINLVTHSIFDKDDNEILFFQIRDNETPKYAEDDFYILNFTNEGVKVESSDFSRISAFMSSRKMMEKLVKWLVKDKVIQKDGTIDSVKLDIFFNKYDEKILERTIRN